MLAKQGKPDEAITEFREATQLDPDFAPAYTNLGNALVDQGKLDEAIDCYRTAIELEPENAKAHYNLGSNLVLQGRPDEAIPYLRRAIELEPGCAGAHYNMGHALMKQGRPDEAIPYFRRATELNPNWVDAYCHLGRARYQAGNWQAAAKALGKADAMLGGRGGAIRMLLAMAHWQSGDKERARQIYAQGAAWIASHAGNDEGLNRALAEAEELMGITEEDRNRLVEEYLARPAEKTSEEGGTDMGDQGAQQVEPAEPAADP